MSALPSFYEPGMPSGRVELWLTQAAPGAALVFHRGLLARDLADPELRAACRLLAAAARRREVRLLRSRAPEDPPGWYARRAVRL